MSLLPLPLTQCEAPNLDDARSLLLIHLPRFADRDALARALGTVDSSELVPRVLAAWFLRQYDSQHTARIAEQLLGDPSIAQGDTPLLRHARARLQLALADAYNLRGEHESALSLADEARDGFQTLRHLAGQSDADWVAANIVHDLGDSRLRNQFMRSAATLAQEAEDAERMQTAEMALACFAAFEDAIAAAVAWGSSVRAHEDTPVPALRALAQFFLFITEWAKGACDAALAHALLSIQASEECGQMRRALLDNANVASLLMELGDLDAAAARLRYRLDIARHCAWPHPLGCTLSVFSEVLVRQNRADEARVYAQQAVSVLSRVPRTTHFLNAQLALADAQLECGDVDAAERGFVLVNLHGRHVELVEDRAYALFGLARVAHARGDLPQARSLLDKALHQPHLDPDQALRTLICLSRVAQAQVEAGVPDVAEDEPITLLQRALRISNDQLEGAQRHELLLELADRLQSRGRESESIVALRGALEALAADKRRATERQGMAMEARHRSETVLAEAQHNRELARKEAARARELQATNRELSRAVAALEAAQRELIERHHELQKANERIQELSLTDPLTGLRNRRFLTQVIDKAVAETLRAHARPAAVAEHESSPADAPGPGRDLLFFLLDVDHFKQINDGYGHAVGDAVLVEVAARLREATRGEDLLVRWGGEEFLIVARHARREEAPIIAERLLGSLREAPIRLPGGALLSCTASLGVASFPNEPGPDTGGADGSWERALERADAALYDAKRLGRNRWAE
ncbi:diguanylate cyclase [Roseateles sp. SL47]|uniref:GGDEF domain-containing protein n=1 Tax=Roseateles sp. SL47 TaxID=2995138 RepID=UPI00227193B7|nr:GGDEF domain-containing protein [Roseateles sp. SL47]WAC73050.1 diguanylate cyclase [Roseateles sp. SL47]